MALINLRSSLAWYDQKPGFAPNAAVNESDYKGNINDSTYFTIPQGYNNQGFATYFTPRVSADAFAIDDASYSFRGTARRRTQQGAGSKFPIGPKGQQHDFDIPRLGFHRKNKYGDLYSSLTTFGLADTYTKDSPIDDVYNIVKVRDVSYDPFGYASPPYILRGIQRDDNRYPQRWGTGNQIADTVSLALGVPRGGALAFGERAGNDVARLAKMMIRPLGLGWIAKQALLHLMNPNTEGVTGFIQRPNNHKVSNPLNTLLAAGVSGLGIHPRKHGLLPIGGLGRYEDIHSARNIQEIFTPGPIGQFNRLRRLTGELYTHYELPILPYWNTITGITGPDTVGGIGVTQFSRDVQGNLDQLLRFPGEQTSGQLVNSVQGIFNTLTPAQYLRIRRTDDSKYGRQGFVTYPEFYRSPLAFTLWDGDPGVYAYTRDYAVDSKRFPVVRGIAYPGVFFVTKGTRPDTNSTEWKISIPRLTTKFRSNSGIRTNNTAPLNLAPVPLEELTAYTDLFRSQFNPYNMPDAGVGIYDSAGQSPLEARYYMREDLDNVGLPGIPKAELTDRPGNKFTLSDVRVSNGPAVNGNTAFPSTVSITALSDLAKGRDTTIYRDAENAYGAMEYGYSFDGASSPLAWEIETSGSRGSGESPFEIKDYLLGAEKTSTKRLDGKAKNSTTAYSNIQKYKAWGYPQISKVSHERAPGSTKNLDFTTLTDWAAANTPLGKLGLGASDNLLSTYGDNVAKNIGGKGPITISIGGNIFPAYITDISTKADQGLLTFKPAGSPIGVLAGAQDFKAGFDFSFIVAAHSEEEFNSLWTKLKSVQGNVKPSVASAVWAPQSVSVKIGNFIDKTAYLTSMALSIDTEYPWNIDENSQRPMYIDVQCGFEEIDGSGIYG